MYILSSGLFVLVIYKKKNFDGIDIYFFVDKNNYVENVGCVFDFEMKLIWFNSF